MMLLKPVLIIAIVAVAMIGVMVPSVFAQIDVTVTPYKESHHIDEHNSVSVKLSKVVPNTDLCYEIIQDGDIIFTNRSYNPNYSNHIGISNHYLNDGKYTVRVFYGSCNLENSFGNDSTQIILDKEPSNLSKFIQQNYFPEKMDVGLNFFKNNGDTTYRNFLKLNLGNGWHYESTVTQTFGGITVVISKTDPLGSPEVEEHLNLDWVQKKIIERPPFKCLDSNHAETPDKQWNWKRMDSLTCIHDDITVIVFGDRYDHVSQRALFMDVVTKKINSNPIPSQSKLSSMYSTQSVDTTTSLDDLLMATAISIQNNECGEGTFLKNNVCVVELTCGKGTIEQNGQCVVDNSSSGGGCLIATATYGSEMALEVQQLRELRDNQLLNTESGTQFMQYFNEAYYSFSPVIADYERENPYFKEVVKLAITPLISSLSILNYVDMDSESEVLGYGISLILLNLGMYLGVPAVVIVGIRKTIF